MAKTAKIDDKTLLFKVVKREVAIEIV